MIAEHQRQHTPSLLTRKGAAARLNVSVTTLERYVARGMLPTIKFGPHKQSRVRFDPHAVDEALQRLTTGQW